MSNNYGISEKDEKDIRARDIACIYCHKAMKAHSSTKGTPGDKATVEHLNNDGPFNEKSNIAICCGSCNASRNNRELLVWFKMPYCVKKDINEKTVAKVVREYVRYVEKFINQSAWVFAKTMSEIPHYYIVRDSLCENDKKIFDEFAEFIRNNGYVAGFYSKQYEYLNIGKYKYWVMENILNRASLKLNNN